MALSDHVSISISTGSVSPTRVGFGIPMVISHSATWAERVRTYSNLAAVVVDFAVTTSPEYLAAQALFAQSPRPKNIKIGRASLQPTQVYKITPLAVNSHTYIVNVKGEGVTPLAATFTSDASATVAEIVAGLETAINAAVGKNFTAVDTASTHLLITGTAAGDWFSLEVNDQVNLVIEQTHVDPGIATDLAAITVEDDNWYFLLTNFNSNAMVTAAAAYIETKVKVYAVDVNETDALNTVVTSVDTLDDLKTTARVRTYGSYHHNPYAMFSAAWVGKGAPQDPGSITWKYKTLSGPGASTLTSTQRNNLIARSANFYQAVSGVNITQEGTMASGRFIDITRGSDWIEDDMGAGVFTALALAKKVPFTDPGIAVIESEVRATLNRAIDRQILAADPEPTVTVPLAADVSAADKTARSLTGVEFDGTFAGAIHTTTISGNITS